MTTKSKCEAIVKKIVELANSKGDVVFEADMGDNSLTVCVANSHTHCGCTGNTFAALVDDLYSVLHGGPGLSWVTIPKEATP